MGRIIGVIVGDDSAFEEALIERLNAAPGVRAELVEIGAVSERHICRYDLIFDRFSQRVPHYRVFLRAAVLAGTTVVEDPFGPPLDALFGLGLAARLGLGVPRAALLPQKAYGAGIVHDRSLRNLEHPLDWHRILHYVKAPAWLRAVDGDLAEAVRVGDLGELWRAFEPTGERPHLLQQDLQFDVQLSVITVQGGFALAFHRDPASGALRGVPEALGELGARAAEMGSRLSGALGRVLNRVELGARAGKLTVVSAAAAALPLGPEALGEEGSEQVLAALASFLGQRARDPHKSRDDHRWFRALEAERGD